MSRSPFIVQSCVSLGVAAAVMLLGSSLAWTQSSSSSAASASPTPRVQELEAEVADLRERLDRLERGLAPAGASACPANQQCAPLPQRTLRPQRAPAPIGPAPDALQAPAGPSADPADRQQDFNQPRRHPPRDNSPGHHAIALPFTGQTLAGKVSFLQKRCRQRVVCAARLARKRAFVPAMTIEETRRFSASVARCAHQCAVEIAVAGAVDVADRARAEVADAEASPLANIRPPPPGNVDLLESGSIRGLPTYPGAKGSIEETRRFLGVRCLDIACARLSLSASSGSDGPAVLGFLRTCAEACATAKGIGPGQ